MEKIIFEDDNAPYLSAENLNQMQDNVEAEFAKYDTIKFAKTADQTFNTNSYDNNNITFDECSKTSENSECYMLNNRIYHTAKVKRISVVFNFWTDVTTDKNLALKSSNLGIGVNTIEPSNSSNQIHQTIEFCPNGEGYIDLAMYQAGTVKGDAMWNWALVNIKY